MNLKPLIAKEDILVWKFIFQDNRAPYYTEFCYSPNKTEKEVKLKVINAIIEEGYHSWCSRSIAKSEKSEKFRKFGKFKVVKFYIPKGSEYFIGEDGDIVSNKIRSGDLKSQ